jgi:hypothetical protein
MNIEPDITKVNPFIANNVPEFLLADDIDSFINFNEFENK